MKTFGAMELNGGGENIRCCIGCICLDTNSFLVVIESMLNAFYLIEIVVCDNVCQLQCDN